jgi:hypothetical protein
MEALGTRGGIASTHFTSALDGVVSFTPRPRFIPSTHWTGGCVGVTAGLDTEVGVQICCLCQ